MKSQKRWDQSVVFENKPEGAGSVGTAAVERTLADGYTILPVNSGHSINPHVYPKLGFNALKDFTPVVRLTSLAMDIFVHPPAPAKNLAEFIALDKFTPHALSFASSGNGDGAHLLGKIFMAQSDAEMVHIPYCGSAPAIAPRTRSPFPCQ